MHPAAFSEAAGAPRPVGLPAFCLFLSGAASLTYELIWIKQFALVFGGTVYAISAVLCAFMSGLALGAWAVSRWLAKGGPRPVSLIQLYGLLEGGIGLWGALFPWLLDSTASLYPVLAQTAGGSEAVLHFLEFLWGTLLMLPSTFLMGATLPVVGSWAVARRTDTILPNVSLLYGLNTLGAVAGCLATQFIAVPWLGVRGATWTAVALNGVILLVCGFWAPPDPVASGETRAAPPAAQPPAEPVSPRLGRLLLALFGFSGMVALSCEILWTRVLVFPLGSSLYSFALILAAFLFGIAAGSLAADRLLHGPRLVAKFIALEAGIGLLGLLMIPVLDQVTSLTTWLDSRFYDPANTAFRTLVLRSAVAFGLMTPPAIGFGLVFPLANQIHLNLFTQVPTTLGGSYAVNTLGAILGTVLTPFVFIPLWGIERSLFYLFGGLLLLAAATASGMPGMRWRRFALPAAAGLTLALYLAFHPGVGTAQLGQRNLSRLDFKVPLEQLKLRAYREGPFATLSVVEDTQQNTRTLFVDGFSTATVSEGFGGTAYMQAMGLVPMLLHPHPQDALVMCFGTGNTMGTVALFPGVRVDGVEIDRNVLSLASWFRPWNRNVMERSNVRFIVQDARRYVRWARRRYDVITLEPMHPAHAGVAHLYSREFYEQAAARLKPGGLMMQWLPLHLLPRDDSLAMLRTFRQAFAHTSVWNSFLTRIVLLVGSDEPVALDYEVFARRMEDPKVARAARETGVRGFLDLMDFFITDTDALRGVFENVDTITDDRPLLEHSRATLLPPFLRETDETFLNLLLRRLDQIPPVRQWPAGQREAVLQGYALRTAQRLSIFAQRYRGPGARRFAEKEFASGMRSVKAFWKKNAGNWIEVSDAGWRGIPMPR